MTINADIWGKNLKVLLWSIKNKAITIRESLLCILNSNSKHHTMSNIVGIYSSYLV